MTILRFDPMRDLVSLRDAMDRLFEESFVRPSGLLADGGLSVPIDLQETADRFTLKASVPGIPPEKIEIEATMDGVTIKGELEAEKESKDGAYVRQERRYGEFQRTLTLPVEIDPAKAEATFEHGILTLVLPKSEIAKPKQVKIKAVTT